MNATSSASRYTGTAGEGYYRWQSTVGEAGAQLNLWKFEPHVERSDRVVDFGCGGGALLSRLQCAERVGVEVSEPARRDCVARGIDVVASAEKLTPGWADVVISNHALEHTTAPLAELRALREAMKPGGKLVLWLPLDEWRNRRRADKPDHNFHLYTWTPQLLVNLLTEAGYEVDNVSVVTSAWLPWYRPLEAHLPRLGYRAMTWLTSAVKRRRQLCALARRPIGAIDGPAHVDVAA